MDSSTRGHTIDIATSANELWRSITDPDRTRRYWYGALNRSAWVPGARWTSESESGELFLEGEILEIDAPHKLVQTLHVVHEPNAAAESPSILTWEITPNGDACRLRVVHEDLGPATLEYVQGGWEHILAGLKTFLESDAFAVAERPRRRGASFQNSQMI
jgi:uncharacterized protein YndB with AHSA1/START domain